MTDLPSGWARARIGDLTRVQYGKALRRDDRVESGRYPVFGSAGVAGRHTAALVEGPVIVVGRKGNAGAVWLSEGPCWPIDTTYFLRIPKGLDSKFLALQLAAGDLAERDSSTAVPSLRRPDLEQHRIGLAPVAEQDRIVTAVEEHFSHLDAAEEAVRDAARRLPALRFGLVEHRLGRTGAPIAKLADVLSEPLKNGHSVRTASDGFPVLRLTALRHGRVLLGERKGGAWAAEDAEPFLVKSGDFLVSRGNGSLNLVGRGGLVDTVPDPVAYPDTLIRVRVDESRCDPRYLTLVWNSAVVRRQIETSARTTAGIYKVNQQMLKEFEFPLPAVEDQRRIIDETERALEAGDVLDRACKAARRRAKSLRRAVLEAAFTGRLVPQDSADEPVSALLERIAEFRASKDGPRKKAGAPK